jgi:hypothetical protein
MAAGAGMLLLIALVGEVGTANFLEEEVVVVELRLMALSLVAEVKVQTV